MKELPFFGKRLFTYKTCDSIGARAGSWTHGYPAHRDGCLCLVDLREYADCGEWGHDDWVPVNPKTLVQFTGLYSEQGQGISTKSVIQDSELPGPAIVRGVADLEEKGILLVLETARDEYITRIYPDGYRSLKFLGHICDNPELLKEIEG